MRSDRSDPTKAEMLELLSSRFCMSSEDMEEAEVAMYYFAADYHAGQTSNLYSVLSTSPFKPGPMGCVANETHDVREMYACLEQEFINEQ